VSESLKSIKTHYSQLRPFADCMRIKLSETFRQLEDHVIQRHERFLKLAILVMFVLSVSSIAWAQDAAGGNNLTYSGPVNGEITDAAFTQNWTLQTASADRITVRVERTDGNLIPDVAILDANAQVVQSGYGPDRTGAASEIEAFTLPAGGTYQIQVGRKDGETGLTSGKYTLTVTPNATAEDNPNNTLVIGPVTADTPVSGEITGAHWYDRYTFDAQGADVIRVHVQRTSGTLFPEVEVLDANGTSLSLGYTSSEGDSAQIDRVELPGAGTFTVAVTRQSRLGGETAGKFDLTVSILGAGEDNPMLAPAAGHDVVYGQPLTGTINARWYDDWKLTTDAGDTISLNVARDAASSAVPGTLQPEVILLGGSGQEITHGYTNRDGASATIDRYQLSGPGTYTVRVSRASGKTGLSSGPYTLMVTLEGSGEGSAKLATPTGTVETGTAIEGQVTNERWQDSWTYQGQADQAIDILVERTSGTLIPLVAILDANGQPLTNGYYEQTWDKASITNYTLPGAGEYKIVVSRDGDQGGYTSGGYSLLVRPHSDQ
jgi:hypothetical protein